MSKKDGFKIEFEGLHEFIKEIEEMPKKLLKDMQKKYTDYGLLVEEGAKALAPHDIGTLEDAIVADKAEVDGNNVSVEVGVATIYALRRHEEPPRMGTHPKYSRGAKFPNYYQDGRGIKTAQKPQWRGHKAGRKYFENAINATTEDYNAMNEKILVKLLEGHKDD